VADHAYHDCVVEQMDVENSTPNEKVATHLKAEEDQHFGHKVAANLKAEKTRSPLI